MNSSVSPTQEEPIIPNPQYDAIFRELDICRQLTRKKPRDPSCMALGGPTGAGKTRLAEELVRREPPFDGPEGRIYPIFHTQVPAETTPKRFAIALLEDLGDPTPQRGDPTRRVTQVLKEVVRDVVILDDFHHLLTVDTLRRRKAVAYTLKHLIRETQKTFVVIGVDDTVEDVLRDYNIQELSRHFGARMSIQPFALSEHSSNQEIAVVYTFLRDAAALAGVTLDLETDRLERLRRILYATNGVPGNIVNLLRYTRILADAQSTTMVTYAMLSQAFNRRLQAHMVGSSSDYKGKRVDPFTTPVDELFPLSKTV